MLNLPMDAHSIGLGGTNVAITDGGINLALNNTALLSDKSHNMLTLNYANYLADINLGTIGYSRSWGKNNFGVAICYMDFGKFQGYNQYDIYQNDFTAKDIVINLLYSRPFGKYFSVGGNLKNIYSAYEKYTSSGMAIDFGASYHNETLMLDMGISIKNIGFQYYGYQSFEGDNRYEPLPLNIIYGISKQLKNAPIRISITLHNLNRFNLNYQTKDLYNKLNPDKIKWHDMMLRHTIFATEILPHKNFFVSIAFNYRHRAEMTIPAFRSLAGFSLGTGLNIKGFSIKIAMAQLQQGNPTYHFSLSSALGRFGIKP